MPATLALDSIDCAETTLSLGAALRRNGGDGELGWLRYGDVSVMMSKRSSFKTRR